MLDKKGCRHLLAADLFSCAGHHQALDLNKGLPPLSLPYLWLESHQLGPQMLVVIVCLSNQRHKGKPGSEWNRHRLLRLSLGCSNGSCCVAGVAISCPCLLIVLGRPTQTSVLILVSSLGACEIGGPCCQVIPRNKLCKKPLLWTATYVKTQWESRAVGAGFLRTSNCWRGMLQTEPNQEDRHPDSC